MGKYICKLCGYLVSVDKISDDYVCPMILPGSSEKRRNIEKGKGISQTFKFRRLH